MALSLCGPSQQAQRCSAADTPLGLCAQWYCEGPGPQELLQVRPDAPRWQSHVKAWGNVWWLWGLGWEQKPKNGLQGTPGQAAP